MNRSGAQPAPPYVRITTELRRRIASGELRAGERVPSTRQIAQEWGVALATATKALTSLCREGVLRAVPRVGTVVAPSEPPPAPSQRTPQRRTAPESDQELSRERIVRAAIRIADAQGLSELSMRSVAARLGVPTMSLYRHVPSKDELVMDMADTVFAEAELPQEPPTGWRAQLELVMRLQWSLYRRHPWLARALSITRPQPVPSGIAHAEWSLRAVDGLGLDLNTMLHVHLTTLGYVRAAAIELDAEAQAEAETGITSAQWLESQDAAVARFVESGQYPLFARVTAAQNLKVDLETLFEFGMQRLLDGLAVFFERARKPL